MLTFHSDISPMAGEVSENRGKMDPKEAVNHINYLELLAVFLTLKALCGDCENSYIQVQCDNTTAVCYINNMGGSKSPNCDWVTRQIWEQCQTLHLAKCHTLTWM